MKVDATQKMVLDPLIPTGSNESSRVRNIAIGVLGVAGIFATGWALYLAGSYVLGAQEEPFDSFYHKAMEPNQYRVRDRTRGLSDSASVVDDRKPAPIALISKDLTAKYRFEQLDSTYHKAMEPNQYRVRDRRGGLSNLSSLVDDRMSAPISLISEDLTANYRPKRTEPASFSFPAIFQNMLGSPPFKIIESFGSELLVCVIPDPCV